MAWIIVCIGVLIAAFALWDSLHDELPENLRLPRSAQVALSGQGDRGPRAPLISSSQWTILADATNLRVSREFLDPISAGGMQYYPPTLHLSCYAGQLYAWLDTGIRAAELAGAPGRAAVQVNGGPIEHWILGEGLALAAPAPEALPPVLEANSIVTLTLAFAEAPEQTLRLSTEGFGPARERLALCSAASPAG